jgi:hypothetical protein
MLHKDEDNYNPIILQDLPLDQIHLVLRGFINKILIKRKKRTFDVLVLFNFTPDPDFSAMERCPHRDSNSGYSTRTIPWC